MDEYLRKVYEKELNIKKGEKYDDSDYSDWKSFLHREDFIMHADNYVKSLFANNLTQS